MKKTKIIENDEEEILLSEKDVWSVIEFARSMSQGLYGLNYLNPDLVSGRMKDVTLNPLAATQDMLDKAMQNPKAYEDKIKQFSQSFELTSMVYKKLISFLANMLSFDITYVSDAEPEDYKTRSYKKDLKTIESFIEKFEYKKEFHTVVREMLRNDAYFGCFRDAGDKYILQELPADYCKIDGRWEGGFLFSFNMYWFLQPGVDIDLYPDFFKRKYREIWQNPNRTTAAYDPALPPELREKSSWIYWVSVPVNVGVCFKLSPELATRLPYFTPLFSDLINQPVMRNLQKNASMAAASKMVIGEVPMLNKESKATVRDSLAISPDLLGKFMALVKSAISDSIKMASAPLQNIKPVSFDAENEIYDSYLKTTLASSGINTNLIFTSDVKQNTIETQLSLNVDEQMMTSLYVQFEDFMNYQANKLTNNFKFTFSFEGTEFYLNRKNRLTVAMDALDKGIAMPQKIAAAIGMKPAQFRKHMEESKAMNFMSMLTPPSFEQQKELLKINQEGAEKLADMNQQVAIKNAGVKPTTKTSTEKKNRGRPLKDDSELGEEGESTRSAGTNIGRGGEE